METKKCSGCKQELPVSEFHKHRTHSSGYQAYCKSCARKKQEETYESRNKTQRDKRKENWLRVLEMFDNKCGHCGLESEYTSVYDLHHVDPTQKEISVGKIMHYNWDKIEPEVKKCILLCANCHRILHETETH